MHLNETNVINNQTYCLLYIKSTDRKVTWPKSFYD